MNSVNGYFKLTALFDGTTINSFFRNTGYPFVQRYKLNEDGSETYTPNIDSLTDDKKPTLVIVPVDSSTGNVISPKEDSIKWSYNQVVLNFGYDGLSTDAGLKNLFKKTTASVKVGSSSYTLPALRLMGNIAKVGNYNSDIISASCSVEVGGQTINISGLNHEVIVEETTGNDYDVVFSDNGGGQLTKENPTIIITAKVLRNGVYQNANDYKFKWTKLGSDKEEPSTTQLLTVGRDDVNGAAQYVCRVSKIDDKSGAVIASGVTYPVFDVADTYRVMFERKSTVGSLPVGDSLRAGQSVQITPFLVDGAGVKLAKQPNWTYKLYNNSGNPFKLDGQTADPLTGANITIKYSDVVKAGYGMYGTAEAKIGASE